MDLPSYKVEYLSEVREQILALTEKARQSRIKGYFLDSLARATRRLQIAPADFGEALYRTRANNGVVHVGMAFPIRIVFAIYAEHQYVLISNIAGLPRSGLDD